MKKYYLILLWVLLFIMNSCISFTIPKEKHIYSLKIVDIDDNPVAGVEFNYQLKSQDKIIKDTTVITQNDGLILDFLYPVYSFGYDSEISYQIKKDGYYSQNGSFNSLFYSSFDKSHSKDNLVNIKKISKTITLIKPIDYIKDLFILSPQGKELKKKILSFIDVLIAQSLLSDSYLVTQSINLINFKNNKYLTFKFVNTNVYNSLKLNKYDIGKILFDEVIRKILNPLNENLNKSSNFFGYDLTVVGYTKSFAENYASNQEIVYRYMIPLEMVNKYKNKDISGQQLLDASIILMDDERIELKLQ